MARRNKKKTMNKPPKIKSASMGMPDPSSAPPPYSEIDYLDQEPSDPPPKTVFTYAISKNTEPNFNGVLKNKLQESFQLFGNEEEVPIVVSMTYKDILDKLSYPTPEENFEDFIIHKEQLMDTFNQGKNNEEMLQMSTECYFYFGTSTAIKISELALYRSYGTCPQKEFLMETHDDVHRVYRKIVERDVNSELKKVVDYFDALENKEEIEKSCSASKSMLHFFAENPIHYLNRELFKSCLLYCDLIGITVRTHAALILELEDSFAVDSHMPRTSNHRQTDPQLDTIRQCRDKYTQSLSHYHRIILANLVEKMPYFLGTAVEEYLEYDENAKKWIELKKIREIEVRTKACRQANSDSILNADLKFRRFARPTSAEQVEMLKRLFGE